MWLFLSFIGYTVAVALTETTFLSTFGYYMLVVSSFIYAIVSHSDDKKQLMRALTLSTYTVVVVAIIVAVLIFAEDADLDIDFGGGTTADIPAVDTKKIKQLKEENDKFLNE